MVMVMVCVWLIYAYVYDTTDGARTFGTAVTLCTVLYLETEYCTALLTCRGRTDPTGGCFPVLYFAWSEEKAVLHTGADVASVMLG
jgi:hypothetical protein